MFVVPAGTGWKPPMTGQTVAGDDAAVGIRLERAVARVGLRAVGHLHLERSRRLEWRRRAVSPVCVRSPLVKMRAVATGREPCPI